MLSETEASLVQQTLQPSQQAQSLPVTSRLIFSPASGNLLSFSAAVMAFALVMMPERPKTADLNASSLSGSRPPVSSRTLKRNADIYS